MIKSKLFPKDSERSRADKLLSNNRIEHLVLKTKPTKDLELKSSPESLAKTKRLLEEAAITKAKVFSPMIDCFLISSDDRITTVKMSLDAAPILKTVGCTVIEANGISMLHYKLVEKYHGKVSLNDMLKDNSFKTEYNKAK